MYYVAGAESYHTGKLKDFAKVGVKAINDDTLQVTLKGKYAYFPTLLAERILSGVAGGKGSGKHLQWTFSVASTEQHGDQAD